VLKCGRPKNAQVWGVLHSFLTICAISCQHFEVGLGFLALQIFGMPFSILSPDATEKARMSAEEVVGNDLMDRVLESKMERK
jgi:hypothetical protein